MLILGWLSKNFITFLVSMISLTYKVAGLGFKIFLILANGNIIDSSSYERLLSNIYVILGIVLLFFIAFAFLKEIINMSDKDESSANIVRKSIIDLITSSIMVILLPTVFTFLFDFQKSVVQDYNVIGKFFGYDNSGILPYDRDLNKISVSPIDYGSYKIVNSVWLAFFNVADSYCDFTDNSQKASCQKSISGGGINLNNLYDTKLSFYDGIEYVNKTGKFDIYMSYSEAVDDAQIYFYWLLSMIAGILLIYISISYCLDMGLRLVKLTFYQIIAPFPIFCRVIPNNSLSDMFKKWLKVTSTCYLEVYIRIFILYFAIFLCNAFYESMFLKNTIETYGGFISLFVQAFVTMGIITFMKQMPKLLAEVTGIDSGNMKLGIKDKLKEGGFFAMGSAAGSLIAGRGNPMAAYRGWKSGMQNGDFKHIGTESQRRRDRAQAKRDGSTVAGRTADRIRGYFGLESNAEKMKRRTEEWRDFKGKNFQTTNTTGTNIGKLDSDGNLVGNPIVKDGDNFVFSYESMRELDDLNADLEVQKSDVVAKGRKFKSYLEITEKTSGYKGQKEKIAENEILQKNKYRLKDETGLDLELEFIDNNGQAHKIESGTNIQFDEWFEKNKELMNDVDIKRITDTLNKSRHDWTIKSFINNNGRDFDLSSYGNSKLLDNNGNPIIFSYTDANGNIQALNNAGIDLTQLKQALINHATNMSNADYDRIMREASERLNSIRKGDSHSELVNTKYKQASDLIQNGFIDSNGNQMTISTLANYSAQDINNLKNRGFSQDAIDAISGIQALQAQGVNLSDTKQLSENISFELSKKLKSFGEDLIRTDLNIAITDNQYIVDKFEEQQSAIKELQGKAKAMQEQQSNSKPYHRAVANEKAVANDKKTKNN